MTTNPLPSNKCKTRNRNEVFPASTPVLSTLWDSDPSDPSWRIQHHLGLGIPIGVPFSLPSRPLLPGRSCVDLVHLYAHVRVCACGIFGLAPRVNYITPRYSFEKKKFPRDTLISLRGACFRKKKRYPPRGENKAIYGNSCVTNKKPCEWRLRNCVNQESLARRPENRAVHVRDVTPSTPPPPRDVRYDSTPKSPQGLRMNMRREGEKRCEGREVPTQRAFLKRTRDLKGQLLSWWL